ncbi:MAG: DUF975 family protein [Verrucomicrobiota bacterium]
MAGLDDLLTENGSLKPPRLDRVVGDSSNKELMAEARAALSGNWGMAVVGYILYMVLVAGISWFSYAAVFFVASVSAVSGVNAGVAINSMSLASQGVQLLLSGAFVVGFCSYFLVIAQEEEARLECLFTGFRRFFAAFGAYFFYTLFVFLWILLTTLVPLAILMGIRFIPGIDLDLDLFLPNELIVGISITIGVLGGMVAAFRYAMAFFVVADDDGGPLEAIRKSKRMMKGKKWKFFRLHWRFFWWWVLATFFTFGIGYLWLIPYMQTSFAKFYEDVR